MIEAAVFVFGAMVGSFLNVCIFRLPAGESIVFPSSHCLSCKKGIAWYDNIPIVSYAILRGRCRSCKTGYSVQYPLVEAATGVLCVVFWAHWGLTPVGVVYLVLSLALLVQAVIDFHHRIIPDEITLPGMVLGLVVSAVFPVLHGQAGPLDGFLRSLAGLLAGGGFLWLAGTIAEKILKKEAMGGGDVKLLGMIGAILGIAGVCWTVFVSSLIGSVIGIYLRLRKGEEAIPFGPFLALAAFLYLFVGPATIDWYLHTLGRT